MNILPQNVDLVSDLVTSFVLVGTRSTFPIKGMSLLMGIDLAGGKVVAKVTSRLITLGSTEKIGEVIPSISPSCAVTQSLAQKLKMN